MTDDLTPPAEPDAPLQDWPRLMEQIRRRTPARLFVGRAGPAYRTATLLELRRDHAAAVDAVQTEFDLVRDFGAEFVDRWRLFEVQTQARDKTEFLARPDLGRRLSTAAADRLAADGAPGVDLLIALGDGL
ncbi:MAG: ethanolamine ammonia-lyase light chain EutC, partial [Planctomycetia bacterium]